MELFFLLLVPARFLRVEVDDFKGGQLGEYFVLRVASAIAAGAASGSERTAGLGTRGAGAVWAGAGATVADGVVVDA